MSDVEVSSRELERILGHKLKPRWTMVLAPNGSIYSRQGPDLWVKLSSQPMRPKKREVSQ